jgi:hypothetical protein
VRCDPSYILQIDGKECLFDYTKGSGEMYYPNLISLTAYLYYLYVQGVLSGFIDLIISLVYVFHPETDFNLKNGPLRSSLDEDLFFFMEHTERAFYIVLLIISILTLSLNGYWVVISQYLLGEEFPIIISNELLNQMIDSVGIFVTSINLIFTVIKMAFIDVSIPKLIRFDTIESFHAVLLWDIFKLFSWAGGLYIFTYGSDLF